MPKPAMNRHLATGLLGLALPLAAASNSSQGDYSLVFDSAKFTLKSTNLEGRTIHYRAYEGIVYVKFPVDPQYQSMNIYVPVEYFEGKAIGPYNAQTAPIFLPNSVGGYMPGPAGSPERGFMGKTSAALVALSKGYVVAAPGARGRTSTDASGRYTGKAPAAIVDLKAAVRYLRANDAVMPGSAEKIVSNGTSAGGALSALLGASGDNPDYEPYLKALGAAETRDDVFAVSAYCPITNLDNADMAYEWLFSGINTYRGGFRPPQGQMPAGAMTPGAPPAGGPPAGGMAPRGPGAPGPAQQMSVQQIAKAKALKSLFPAYLNSLHLRDQAAKPLSLDPEGNGTFKQHLKGLIIASAQRGLNEGKDLSKLTWIKVMNHKVTDLDWDHYVQFAGRMKPTQAFDGSDLGTGENSLFGTDTLNAQHFTTFSKAHSTVDGKLADPGIVKLMNPMNYIGTPATTVSRHWRIRHGAIDRDTSLAIPAILATRLQNSGAEVDFAAPWGQGHGGDYDLDELFQWVETVCR